MSDSVFSFDPSELFPPEKLTAAYDRAVDAVRLLLGRVAELEAENAVLRGTLARPEPDDDQPEIIHDVPPNAPR
jgi:hypothetical protein